MSFQHISSGFSALQLFLELVTFYPCNPLKPHDVLSPLLAVVHANQARTKRHVGQHPGWHQPSLSAYSLQAESPPGWGNGMGTSSSGTSQSTMARGGHSYFQAGSTTLPLVSMQG